MAVLCGDWGLAGAALRQHAAAARVYDRHDHAAIFAIVGLWFKLGAALSEAETELCSLPTHKLLPLSIVKMVALVAHQQGSDGSSWRQEAVHGYPLNSTRVFRTAKVPGGGLGAAMRLRQSP